MKTILLAEDDKKIAQAITIRLKASGFSVITAFDVPNALMQARKHEPDLVLLDIGLPGGSGFHVAECLRNQIAKQHIPVIFITASKKEGLRAEARKLGASAFLEKPFNASQLISAIDSALLSNPWDQPTLH